eukprot:m.13966 g.13966  ORF g.13966 m.13966 type:complete len:133 (+) comp7475_c1_seq1:238-636(+)
MSSSTHSQYTPFSPAPPTQATERVQLVSHQKTETHTRAYIEKEGIHFKSVTKQKQKKKMTPYQSQTTAYFLFVCFGVASALIADLIRTAIGDVSHPLENGSVIKAQLAFQNLQVLDFETRASKWHLKVDGNR